MIHKISILFLVLLTAGCVKVQKKGDTEKNPDVTSPAQTPAQVAAAEVTPGGFDFDYDFSRGVQQVRFHIPVDWELPLVVEKSAASKQIFEREILLDGQTWSDSLNEDVKVSYKFFKKSGDQKTLLKEIDVVPAMDLDLDSELDLQKLYVLDSKVKKIHIRHLTMTSKAKILVGDYNGKITIENLDSDQGALQTFSEDARASSGHGRHVGGFKLEILAGEGQFKINLFAESGANGNPALPPDESKKGTAGADGPPAEFYKYMPVCQGDLCLPVVIFDCTAPPKSGGDGGRGLPGYSGNNGGNGGSVKKISVVNNSPQLNFEINSVAGTKGFGSAGGAGGEGGRKGRGGDGAIKDIQRSLGINPDEPPPLKGLAVSALNVGKTCSPAPDGVAGAYGIQGPPGNDGTDGRVF